MASEGNNDLKADAKNFCESLGNVFMRKRRDSQTQHLLEKAKSLIEALLTEKRTKTERPSIPPKPSRAPGTPGQLWVKLDELKRENDALKKRIVVKGSDEKASPGKTQGPGDVIIADLQKTKLENDNIKVQLEKSQTTVKELEKINASLQDEFKRTKISQDMAVKTLAKIKKEHQTLESSLNTVKTENDSLKQRLTQSVKPMKRADLRLVENINEKCRPSNIAIHYNNLESQEWVDAKEAMEDAGFEPEEDIIKFLCAVLMICYEASSDLLSEVEAVIAEILKDPSVLFENAYVTCVDDRSTLPDDLVNSIKDILRQHVDDIGAEPLINRCKDKLVQEGSWTAFEGFLNNKSLQRYVEQCARITWQMVTQQTPMWLSTCDTHFDDDKHKLWWSCSQSKYQTIDFFIWPALYDYKNGCLMVKGCVYTS